MSDEFLDRCARCGLLLVDLTFLQKLESSEFEQIAFCDYELDCTLRGNGWLSPVQSVSLSQATLMTAWHMAHWDADAAAVLSGVERSFIHGLAQIDPSEISQVARKFGHLLLPRWHDRADIWHDMLSLGTEGPLTSTVSITVRGLQLSGALYRPLTRGFGRKLPSNPSLPASRP